MPHTARERFAARFPQHVTLRVRDGLRSLRRRDALRVLKRAIVAGGRRDAFRIVHYNLLANHLHFIAEATDAESLARGMQGLEVRLARGFNRALGRKGKLFRERYHSRTLRTPREVRNALRYVLLNARHHAAPDAQPGRFWIDPYSSAAWFDGWRETIRELRGEPRPTAAAACWLLSTGWRRWGLLEFDERPG